MEKTFEDALDDLIAEHEGTTEHDELVSALELAVMKLKEAGEAGEV
ncbi:MAG TPA: hypothetical protein VHT52_23150 [Stellaceae bacterium]|jgi:hypothetical protein|nr:hypothetical protein [Stellaceae bacterium]